MAVAIARHYVILDEVIAAHGGVRPVEQGEGDSVVGVFSRASDAVAAAVDAQRVLSEESWPGGTEFVCEWRSTPATRSSATKGTTSVRQ